MPDSPESSQQSETGPTSRRNRNSERITRACSFCKTRKIRCTGELPKCRNCQRHGKACVYRTEMDRRATDRTAQLKIDELQSRVQELESILAAQRNDIHTSSLASSSHIFPNCLPSRGRLSQEGIDEMDPFETGRLVLSSTGNLHLHPSATFYCPAHVIPEWRQALDTLGNTRSVALPAYLAPYLPFHTTQGHHRKLVDLAFDCMLCFGPNPLKDKFLDSMDFDPDRRGLYFSPILHLTILGIGWRYCTDPEMLAMYYAKSPIENRGSEYVDKARDMVMQEADTGQLSNMLALMVMALFYVGQSKDTMAGSCFMMCQYQCLNFRVHKQCDAQLYELGLAPGSELDIARRDVWNFCLNISAWWATFYAEPVLPMAQNADQRPTDLRNSDNTDLRLLSLMALHHSRLSHYGLESLITNHLRRMPIEVRVKHVRELGDLLFQWRDDLPSEITWPPPSDASTMHPGNIITHGMYATYLIILYRPYIIEVGGGPSLIPEALRNCLQYTKDIVDMARYLVKHHGIMRAPLSWQHILYVGGTMLILQIAGLPNVTIEERTWALESLTFIQEALQKFSYIWPAARLTAQSLKTLQEECSPTADNTRSVIGGDHLQSTAAEVDLGSGEQEQQISPVAQFHNWIQQVAR
ncbi:hypothetical protein AYX14_01363 [Cryptococcus neoformans]|nr:hypothetical protein AYX14_01363 [Cryptococcus neoformans var. grubii]OWZ80686.1 hypothetical protein C365_00509 [Cryptococcus neoformans var. grubii Bt85]OXM81543.1 hypothetical protein C364_00512 [Cryptococcus neoformans var. grubii Bt63]